MGAKRYKRHRFTYTIKGCHPPPHHKACSLRLGPTAAPGPCIFAQSICSSRFLATLFRLLPTVARSRRGPDGQKPDSDTLGAWLVLTPFRHERASERTARCQKNTQLALLAMLLAAVRLASSPLKDGPSRQTEQAAREREKREEPPGANKSKVRALHTAPSAAKHTIFGGPCFGARRRRRHATPHRRKVNRERG